ncbi:hypothetical protein DSUL_100099 [Desulfovibrionales bacterium]
MELFVPQENLDDILVVIGSYDNTLNILVDELICPRDLDSDDFESFRQRVRHYCAQGRFSSFTGVYLFDPVTGDYNFSVPG